MLEERLALSFSVSLSGLHTVYAASCKLAGLQFNPAQGPPQGFTVPCRGDVWLPAVTSSQCEH